MAQFILFLSFAIASPLIFLYVPPLANALSTSSSKKHQILDVYAKMKKAHQVFSISRTPSKVTNSSTLHSSTEEEERHNHSKKIYSFPLHSSSSLFPPTSFHNNNTLLTLSRLAGDVAHRRSPYSASLNQLVSPVYSGMIFNIYHEHIARIHVGTPPVESYLSIDTGSDITWIHCDPLTTDNMFHLQVPIFHPSASSTYRPLRCNSNLCFFLPDNNRGCDINTNTCLYNETYEDTSISRGIVTRERVFFGPTSLRNIAIGCSHENYGKFSGSSGILGLGGDSLSIPSQIQATSFSYCLVDHDSSNPSTLEFNSVMPSESVVVPLRRRASMRTYHYITIRGFGVDGRVVRINSERPTLSLYIDSGTTATWLHTGAYIALRDAFHNAFVQLNQGLSPSPIDGGFGIFDTCYELGSMPEVNVPRMHILFAGGDRLRLQTQNYLTYVGDGTFCLAFAELGPNGPMAIGNILQQGMRVTFDLVNNLVGFSPNQC